ncbi:MAG: Ig-like domain-containing protein [Chloroflexota bacterium]|nr:Ig-like domain-containing protein [Chloroflexota bacterium]
MTFNHTVSASLAAFFILLRELAQSHPAAARIVAATIVLTAVIAVSQQEPIRAGPGIGPAHPSSLLPEDLGVGVETDHPVAITFGSSMDRASVQGGLALIPDQPTSFAWSRDGRTLTISPMRRWRTDQRYLVVVPAQARTVAGRPLGRAERYSFTTQTAPTITDFTVDLAGVSDKTVPALPKKQPPDPVIAFEVADAGPALNPPDATVADVSAHSGVTIGFSTTMNRADVAASFAISPKVAGKLSWSDRGLVFTAAKSFERGQRYTISLRGAHDLLGNALGGDTNFSFTTRDGGQLVRARPGLGARSVTDQHVELWFSQPMAERATNKAFSLTDATTAAVVSGELTWNADRTQLRLTPDGPFADGHTYVLRLGKGTADADGYAFTQSWSFTMAGVVPQAPAPVQRSKLTQRAAAVVPPPAPSGNLQGRALNQINAARSAYGFVPLVLDAAVSAVAYGHAYDQAANGYFSHVSLDGRTRDDRLRAGGISYGYSAENLCFYNGIGVAATLDWCHAAFMAEPYPGQWNHIGNILDPRLHRVGVGIAQVGGSVVIVWDFVD